jgi:hypothetical protein
MNKKHEEPCAFCQEGTPRQQGIEPRMAMTKVDLSELLTRKWSGSQCTL